MMRNPEQTIGNLIDKANLTIIAYEDLQEFPVSRAMLARGSVKESEYSGLRQTRDFEIL